MDPVTQLIIYCLIVGIFHVSEFVLAVKYNPDKVDASCEYHGSFGDLFCIFFDPVDILLFNVLKNLIPTCACAAWLVTTPYVLAMTLGLLEFVVHNSLVPMLSSPIDPWVGVIMCCIGEGIRKCGMMTCKRGFTHRIQTVKSHDHELTTHGIYGLVRHPGYLGWLLWCVGTQIVLQNVICGIGFFIVVRVYCKFYIV